MAQTGCKIKMLKESYEDVVHELKMMPVKSSNGKKELTKKLNKNKKDIKVFSKPKAFVKLGA
jgi:hypothetical protein